MRPGATWLLQAVPMPMTTPRIAATLLAMSLLLLPSVGRSQSGPPGWRDWLSKEIRAKTAQVSEKVKEKGNNFARKAAGRAHSPRARAGRPPDRHPARRDRAAPRHRRPAVAPARTAPGTAVRRGG